MNVVPYPSGSRSSPVSNGVKHKTSSQSKDGKETPQSVFSVCHCFYKESIITCEFNLFVKKNISGIYMVPSNANPFDWLGVFFIRQGLYQGAIFRFNLYIPTEFPDTKDPPKIVFEQPVFHPQIDPQSNELNLRSAFPQWRRTDHIYDLLHYLQRVFFRIDPDGGVNEKASQLYDVDPEMFRIEVGNTIRRSREVVYDPPDSTDLHAVRFTPWDPTVHQPVRERVLGYLRPYDRALLSNQKRQRRRPSSVPSSSDEASSSSQGEAQLSGAESAPETLEDSDMVRTKGLSWFNSEFFAVMARRA